MGEVVDLDHRLLGSDCGIVGDNDDWTGCMLDIMSVGVERHGWLWLGDKVDRLVDRWIVDRWSG